MSNREKLFERLKNNPLDCSFSDLKLLLEREGFELVRTSGSHFVFSKDETTFVIPSHNKRVKSVYVKRACVDRGSTERSRMMNIPYPILLYPSPEGGFVAEVPQLKGCLAQGETESECLQELEVVLKHWLEVNPSNSVPKPDTDRFIDRLRRAVNA